MMRQTLALLGALLAGSSVFVADAQDAPQAPLRFGASTELVQVDVSVLDDRRQPVRGLTATDFTILEDGRAQPIEAFAAIDLPARRNPAEAAWTRAVPADVVGNQTARQEGRIVVIVMDRSIPAGHPMVVARQVAAAAIEELGPGDLAAVISTGAAGSTHNLTNDRAALLRVVNDPSRDWSRGESAEASNFERGRNQANRESTGMTPDLDYTGRPLLTALTDGRCLCGTCVPNTIRTIAEQLEGLPRYRKVLLHVGSSIEWQTDDDRNACNFHLRDARNAMLSAVDRAGVTVHSIDPSGLRADGPAMPTALAGGRRQPIASEWQLFSSRGGPRPPATEFETYMAGQNSLGVLPDRTGGRMIVNANAPQTHVPAIFTETDSYYVLGFSPADRDRTRAVRSIEVKVNRPGVRVNARKQYVLPGVSAATTGESAATTGDATSSPVAADALSAALTGLLPATRVPMSLHVAAFATPDSTRATVTVSADVAAFAPGSDALSPAASSQAPLELVTGAYDALGRPQASSRQTLQLSWPPSQDSRPRRVEALSRLELPPGDYEIRVAAAGADAARTASVFTHLTVPDYANSPLALSHIIFGADAGTSTAPPEFLTDVVPVAPTTTRTFARGSGVTAFMQVYQGTTRTDALQPVGVRVRILNARDEAVRDQALVLEPTTFSKGRAADIRFTLPVQNLPAGEYLLSLEARMDEREAGRAVRFEVR